MSQFLRRIQYLLHRRRLEQELADDMEFHREMAARAGHRDFGNTLLLRERARDTWGWTWIDRFGQDLRYTVRVLRKSPLFTAAAVLMLALGIGVNVVAFGFFNLIILRPLPVRLPETLLRFERSAPGNFADNFPYPAVAFYREHSQTLSAVLAVSMNRLVIEGDEKPVSAHFVTANFLSELGALPVLGRILDTSRDEGSGATPVVVLGYGFWQRHFGADPSILGRVIRLNDKPVTVIGVASREFSDLGLGPPDAWLPISQQPYFSGGAQALTDFSDRGIYVQMWGRLRSGLAPKAAEAELRSLAAELHKRQPDAIWEKESLLASPGGYAVRIRREMVPVLALVAALGLLILIVACGNLGSLLLARGVAREREIAIRIALGAGRGRLTRQLFTESLALATLGLAAGLALGYLVLRALIVWAELPPSFHPVPDWRIVLFAVGIGFTASILFGLMPSLQIARQRHRATTLRQLLIGGQVAASCVLLILSGLLVRALNHATHSDPGFAYQQVITIDPALRGYTPAGARSYFSSLDHRLRTLAGVDSIALASNPPLGNRWSVVPTRVAGRSLAVHINGIDPPFFHTMQIPLLRGRNLLPGERHAMIVSESLARLQWPSEDPIGKSFRLGSDNNIVVGVSGSARLVSPEDSDAVEVYKAADTAFLSSMVVLVRTAVPPEALLKSVASIAKSVDPKLFPEVRLMKDSFRSKVQGAGYVALAVSLPGVLALFLACLGVLGMVAYAVSQRTREIGIRMALGAQPRDILTAVSRHLSLPIIGGLVAGVGGAVALSQFLRRLLFGISNLDPLSYLAAIAVFASAVALAVVLPARRALRVDPVEALRNE